MKCTECGSELDPDALETIREERDRHLRHQFEQPANKYAAKNREKANLLTWVLGVLGDRKRQRQSSPLDVFHGRVSRIVANDELDDAEKLARIGQELEAFDARDAEAYYDG